MRVRGVGFTGTQLGMSEAQMERVIELVRKWDMSCFHHGDCIGADAEMHHIVRAACPDCTIVIHPPENNDKRAFCKGDEYWDSKYYLTRNHDIVDASIFLLATPAQSIEQQRSGTWATIRYAMKKMMPILIVYPDGSTESFNTHPSLHGFDK